MTRARLEDSASLGGRLVCKDSDERDNPLRLHFLQNIRRHDGFGHSAGGDRGDDVAEDVVLQALLCECLGETDKSELGSCGS